MMNAELHKNKGIDVAIEALAQAPSSRGILVIIGEGQERKALEKLIRARGLSARVFLLGFIPDARSFLSAADIYLMPSRKEGLPFALLEAGMAALPVIASDTGGIPEVIRNEDTGILIPAAHIDLLAHAITQLEASPEQRTRLGDRLHARVEDDFSETRMIAETLRLYAPSYS